MASHRKPRTRILTSSGSRRTAAGLTTAALAAVTLLSQASQAAQAAPSEPKPPVEEVRKKVEEVQKKVDGLYRAAEVATQKYNAAKEPTERQREKVEGLLDDAAERTEKMNAARRALGVFASAQYRTGGMAPTATLMLTDDPQQYVDRSHLMDRLTGRQKEAVSDYQKQAAEAAKKRTEATENLDSLSRSQESLRTSKKSVQEKLAEARGLLSRLTAEEKARLAAIEREKEAEAQRKAERLARQQAEREREERQAREARERQNGDGRQPGDGTGSGTGSGAGSGTGSPDSGASSSGDGSYAAKAEKVLAFARAQMGKPYVWGASGPNSYDCSGLTQAAWKAAGVDLPRTTWDQVKVGQRVATGDLKPGDLVFFYDDISHVGIYIGDGKMIHAPKPGADVRVESIYYMPIYGSVRPA